jgi:integrase
MNEHNDPAQQSPTPHPRRARKRAAGEGSIYQRQDGMWVASLMVGRRPNGTVDIRKRYAKTQREARAKLNELRQQHADGRTAAPGALTVGEFLTQWLRDSVALSARPATLRHYECLVRVHLLPRLGTIKLAALQPKQLQSLYAALLREGRTRGYARKEAGAGLAPKSVRAIHIVLHRALEQAVRWGYVPRNVADVVDPPAVPHQEMRALATEEIRRLLAAASGHRLAALWTVAIYTGCRKGELLGLRWGDLDWQAATITIRRTLQPCRVDAPSFAEPKTARGRRILPLAPSALVALREHQARQRAERAHAGEHYLDYELVFCTSIGTPLNPRNVTRDFKALLKRAGLPARLRVHDLRHTTATALLSAGVDVASTAAMLGHAQASTTLNVYAHALPSALAGAASRLEQALAHPCPAAPAPTAPAPAAPDDHAAANDGEPTADTARS